MCCVPIGEVRVTGSAHTRQQGKVSTLLSFCATKASEQVSYTSHGFQLRSATSVHDIHAESGELSHYMCS